VSEGNACVMGCDAGKKGFDGGERSEDDRRVTCVASFSEGRRDREIKEEDEKPACRGAHSVKWL